MKTKIIISLAVIVIVAIASYFFFHTKEEKSELQKPATKVEQLKNALTSSGKNIQMSSLGKELAIKTSVVSFVQCKPNPLVAKTGMESAFTLENRDTTPITISIGQNKFNIEAGTTESLDLKTITYSSLSENSEISKVGNAGRFSVSYHCRSGSTYDSGLLVFEKGL